MATPKGQLTKPVLEFLATIVSALVGRNITEFDVRTVCKEAGITAVGQAELSPALRELHERIECSPTSRITTLLAVVPEQMQLVLLMILQTFIEYRINLQHQAEELGESKRQYLLAESEKARTDTRHAHEQCEKLQHLLNESRQTESDLYERIRSLEMANAVMEGRLTERASKVISKGKKSGGAKSIGAKTTRTMATIVGTDDAHLREDIVAIPVLVLALDEQKTASFSRNLW